MTEADLRHELVVTRKENQKLRQELTAVRAELQGWEHNAILLTPEEIFAFYKHYREDKKKEREANDKIVIAEIDKLMVSVLRRKRGNDNDERV